jgi:uncharacterized protein (DUF1697 family)
MAKVTNVALLRGINVGGRTMIAMAKLKEVFESLGFEDVVTYIQTGNVVFTTPETDADKLARQIERKLKSAAGYGGTVFVFSRNELKKAAANNPFNPKRRAKEQQCHLVFLDATPAAARKKALMEMAGDEYRFAVRGKVLYYAYAKADAFKRRTINFEKVLGVTGTARTWKVVDKLIELSA